MEEVESSILKHSTAVEKLRYKRYELIAKKEDLEMSQVIDCAIEAGITSEEMMMFVATASKEKRQSPNKQ